MSALASTDIRGIVFDLDGTLYVCDRFAAEIQNTATKFIARLSGISQAEAGLIMAATRQRLTEESGKVQTISAVCTNLGGSVQELHHFFENNLRPKVLTVV
jgi:putative hydrolase of the HAD superfamily